MPAYNCPSGHYVCNEYHASDSIKVITQFASYKFTQLLPLVMTIAENIYKFFLQIFGDFAPIVVKNYVLEPQAKIPKQFIIPK